MPVLLIETDHAFTEVRLRAELRRLRRELIHEILRQDLRKSTDVEDVFLGIQCLELAAELRKRVDDARGRPAHSGIELGEQSRRAAADDRDVNQLVGDFGRHGLEE